MEKQYPFFYCSSCPDNTDCDFTDCMYDKPCDKPVYVASHCDHCNYTPNCFPDLMARQFKAIGKRITARKTIGATKRNQYKEFLKRNNID